MSSLAPAARLFARVQREREALSALVAAHHAARPRIFGSVARGDDEPGSDVDLLVDFDDGASLLDEVGLRLALQDLLQCDRSTSWLPTSCVALDRSVCQVSPI